MPLSRNLASLTGLRFFAICVVFVSHAALFSLMRTGADYSVLYPLGALGVSLFFILSGFVLTYSARDADTTTAFWRRRFFKIYPSHVAAWLAAMAFIVLASVPRVPPGVEVPVSHDITNLFLVQTLLPWEFSVDGGNGVAWSLVCEMVFYLLFPVIYPLVRRIPGERLVLAAVAVVAVAWLLPLGFLALPGAPVGSPIGADLSLLQLGFAYFWPLARLPEFVLGMVLARVASQRSGASIGILPATALVAAFVVVGQLTLPDIFLASAITVIPLGLLIHATATADLRERKSFLRQPFVEFLGKISYAFYLVHFTVLMVLYFYLPASWPNLLVLVVAFLVGHIAAWGLYAFVERPFMRWLSVKRPEKHSEAVAAM
jgi:peptidoglycan/LPS O-acetylase OafA/YrhL